MISLWNDQETNNYFLINNDTGEKQKVYRTGDYLKEFDAALTGQVSYQERVKLAKKPGYLPMKATSLENKFNNYTPSIDKLLWYTQCPRPAKLPNLTYFKTEKKHSQKQNTQPLFFGKTSSTLPINGQTTIASNYTGLLGDQQLKSIQTIQHQELDDPSHFKEMSKLFNSSSYDYQSFNSPQKNSLKSSSIKDFERILKEEKQQMEMFQLPQDKKQLINTKGRFPIELKRNKDFVEEDKTISKLLQPDLYKEKILDQKQEELRRKINKLKEKEMLDRNLRNKV